MRKLNLEFIPQRQRMSATSLGLVLLACTAMIWVAQQYWALEQNQQNWQAKQKRWQQTQTAQTASTAGEKAKAAQTEADIARAERVIASLALPWNALFNEIEASLDQHVILLSVEPSVEKRSLLIGAEARDLSAMLAYAKRLGNSTILRNAHVRNHQIQSQGAQRFVRFVISAEWRPDAEAASAAPSSSQTMQFE